MRIEEADTDGSDSFDSLDSTRSQIIKTTRQTLNTADKEDRKVATEPRSMPKYLIMNEDESSESFNQTDNHKSSNFLFVHQLNFF